MKNRIVAASLIAAFLVATAAAVAARFGVISGAEPTVSDSRTGLVWQGCAAGLRGNLCTENSAGTYAWQQALAYCEGLSWGGQFDWYLPNVTELSSIVDDHRATPAIDPAAFPYTPPSYFWSSSSYAGSASRAWGVVFDNGGVGRVDKLTGYAVRCVRRGP